MPQSSNLLLIFVKHPEKGKVKTRLAAGIGTEKALEIYQRLLAFTLEVAEQVEGDKVVFYGNPMPTSDLWSKAGYPRFQQEGEDLGIRMENAFQWGYMKGYKKIIIIGSDCAQISAEIINAGFANLEDQDAVIGPATDGGYYLLGLKKLISSLFYCKTWSTNTVFADTVKDLEYGGFHYDTLPMLSDVDTMADLKGTFLEEEFL
jgi:rSAM/selenodomain-associated transferase 1